MESRSSFSWLKCFRTCGLQVLDNFLWCDFWKTEIVNLVVFNPDFSPSKKSHGLNFAFFWANFPRILVPLLWRKTEFHAKFKGPTHLTQEMNKALLRDY